jgi:glycosyltransferase involved in cell wall biosynthesis
MINATEITERRVRRQMVLYRPLMRLAERMVFGCHMQMELWCNRYGLDARNCHVIYNGIDEKRFSRHSAGQWGGSLAVPAGIEKEDFLVGAVGTLWPNKNHAELIAMLETVRPVVPNAKLLIAGEGPERQRLLDAADEAGVSDSVYLLGEVDDVRPILERVDVFVLPSISETFSNAVLEAMAMEKVVIVSDTGGMREMVTDEVDGFVYEQGNVAALCTLIERLAADPERRSEIGRNARKTVEKRFTFDRMIDEYVKLLA